MTTSHISVPRKAHNWLYLAALLAITVEFAVMYQIVPFMSDDIWYLVNTTGEPGSLEYLRTTFLNCVDHLNYDTGRLCNTVAFPFLGSLPRMVFTACSAFWIFCILAIPRKVCGFAPFGIRNALWIFTVVFVFPWLESMFTVIFAMNYVWALGLLFVWIYLFIKWGKRKDAPVTMSVGLFMLSLVVGWWHEGMSAPLGCALLGCYACLRIGKCGSFSKMQWVMLAGGVCGIAILLSMPALRTMGTVRESHLIKTVLWETLVNVVAYNLFFYIYLLFFIVMASVRRLRGLLSRRDWAVAVAVLLFGLASCAFYFRYFNGARTGAFSQMICAVGFLWLIGKLNLRRRSKLAGGFFLLIFILCNASLIQAIRMQTVLSKEYLDVQSMYQEAKRKGTPRHDGKIDIYYDPTPIKIGIDGLKPSYPALNTVYGLGKDINLLPTRLEGFRPESTETTDFGNGLMLYHNCLVCDTLTASSRIDVMLTDANGNTQRSRTRDHRFHGADGNVYVYLQAHAQTIGGGIDIRHAEIAK